MASHSAEIMFNQLLDIFSEMGSALICFSGGIDSALLSVVAGQALGESAVAMTAVSASLPKRERQAAHALTKNMGLRHELVFSNEIKRAGYQRNGPDRCFHCKSELYDIASEKAELWSLNVVVNGTNIDDLGDYRPGLEAAQQAKVRSPFIEAGMTKADVRAVALFLKLEIWDKPAAACLSSRLPYGTEVTKERLQMVEQVEDALIALNFRQVRVRYYGDLARIEVPTTEIARLSQKPIWLQAVAAAQRAGFQRVEVDPQGYRQGSLNAALPSRSLTVIQST